MNNFLEVDFSTEIKASRTTKCDGCGKVLGENYPRGRDAIGMTLKDGQDDQGYDKYKDHHYCGEDCLHDHLVSRRKAKSEKK